MGHQCKIVHIPQVKLSPLGGEVKRVLRSFTDRGPRARRMSPTEDENIYAFAVSVFLAADCS